MKRRATLILPVLLALAACDGGDGGRPPEREDPPAATTVFRSGNDGYGTFRIPALAEAHDGTLLAFAEGRVAGEADFGNIDLVLRRSADGGLTWGPLQVLVDAGADRAGNPAAVVDPASGRVLVLFTRSGAGDVEFLVRSGLAPPLSVWVMESADAGATWSAPRDISADARPEGWRWYSTGPGHGIALGRGPWAGRLLVPCNHSTDVSSGDDASGDHVLLSDDGGRTWRLGAVDGGAGDVNPDESTAVERVDGQVLFSSRNQGSSGPHRATALSADGGQTYAAPFQAVEGLEVPRVEASLARLLATDEGDAQDALLFCAPTQPFDREDLGLRVSRDEGATWSAAAVLHAGPSAYCDVAVTRDRWVGVLHEAGQEGPYERIDYARLGGAWLMARTSSTVP